MSSPQVQSTVAAETEERAVQQEEWLREMRGSLMVVAVLVASVTYTAGLNPPGPFFRGQGHFAGDPVLRDKNYNRFATFLAGNTVAFAQSLVIIIMLVFRSTFRDHLWLYLLRVYVVVDVSALVVAYAVGSTREPYDVLFSAFILVVLTILCAAAATFVIRCRRSRRRRPQQ
ncbi:unnamed protein product [Spirodela intermedia]|uniref:PGG domain-containing protein n=1 Tax=Spirodela intermedia TaxID=51605 RepID=A0A7I8JU58_SPIIN|nr:unnamed protein product [Spirodela intermedia]CAA6673737.1 unnamed protein product [Spirodela intermedia]